MTDIFIDATDDNIVDMALIEKYKEEGRAQDALIAAHRILGRQDSIEVRNMLNELFSDMGSVEEARIHGAKALGYAIGYDGNSPGLSASVLLGDLLFREKRYEEAYVKFENGFNMSGSGDDDRTKKMYYCKEMMKKIRSPQPEQDISEDDTQPLPPSLIEELRRQAAEYGKSAESRGRRVSRRGLGYAAAATAGLALLMATFGSFNASKNVKPETIKQPELTHVSSVSAPSPEVNEFEFYTVKKGDSLWKIAESRLGSGKEYVKIAYANGLTGNNPTIHPGDRLVIPFKDVYKVNEGDTLSGISYRVLGDASLWPEIYDANRPLIGDNPDLIYPGKTLDMPKAVKISYVDGLVFDNDFVA